MLAILERRNSEGLSAYPQLVQSPFMGRTSISQKTIVQLMRAFRDYGTVGSELDEAPNFAEELYEQDFPDWFVTHAKTYYGWHWREILTDLRNGRFFFPSNSSLGGSILGEFLSEAEAIRTGEFIMQRLASFATTLPTGESVLRSLQLDGFDVNLEKLALIPLEGPVSVRQEEDALTRLVNKSGVPDRGTILKHIADAHGLYAEGKYHPSLNESRNILQAMIDGISTETDAHGAELWSAMSNHDPSRLTQTRVKRKSSLDGRTRSFIPITLSKLRSRAFHSQLARDNRRIAQHRNAYVVFIVALPTEFADLNERSKRTKVSRYPSGLVAGLMLSRWAKLRRSLEGRLSFSLGST